MGIGTRLYQRQRTVNAIGVSPLITSREATFVCSGIVAFCWSVPRSCAILLSLCVTIQTVLWPNNLAQP